MKDLKTFVANLANRINQAHYLEIELRKVFHAGVRYAQENDGWVDIKHGQPKLLEGKDYSENVLVMVEGVEETQVMVLTYIHEEGEKPGYVWANAHGNIHGDAEYDDDYKVTHWRYVPKLDRS